MHRHLTLEEARRFLLRKHGLLGPKRFKGEAGVLAWIREAGCIQYDPIDICGKNHELVLQSRVEGFKKEMLTTLLYEKRQLLDGWDKNMSIYPVEDYVFFSRKREAAKSQSRGREAIDAIRPQVLETIRQKGAVSSSGLGFDDKIDWAWAPTKLSRAALERLYHEGVLTVHHKENTRKFYDLSERCISEEILAAKDPNKTEESYHRWHVLRRIRSVGLLWSKASDALLGVDGLKAVQRRGAFKSLMESGEIVEIRVGNLSDSFYLAVADLHHLDESTHLEERMEFIAPLDNLLWDRKLIQAIFDFDYKWEIYTPAKDRRYGYYVLPVLMDERFAGRIEIVRNGLDREMAVKQVWPEHGLSIPKKRIEETLKRFSSMDQ